MSEMNDFEKKVIFPKRKKSGNGERKKMSKRTATIIMLIAVIGALLVGLVGFFTDWLWFKDLGYTSVFWKKLLTQCEIAIPVFAIVTLLMRFYLRTLKAGYFKRNDNRIFQNVCS